MSLLTARRIIETKQVDMDSLFNDFKYSLDTYIETPDKLYVLNMINLYSTISYGYLLKTSLSLEPDSKWKDRMVYMNSIIAEVCNEQAVLYFHPQGGYSVIDKSVKYLLDNGIATNTDYIQDIIDDMNSSTEEALEEALLAEDK